MIRLLYTRKKKTIQELEGIEEELKKLDEERHAAREQKSSSLNTSAQSSANWKISSKSQKWQREKYWYGQIAAKILLKQS